MEAKTDRSELTLSAIVDVALEMAIADGLESLTIGEVAKRLGLSKSGVFSRVGSREALQKAVIDLFAARFMQDVFVPAMREPRGLPRLDAMMRLWLRRAIERDIPAGGCLFSAGSFELDDREGPLRDVLYGHVMRWRGVLRRCVVQAIGEGHLLADTDPDQLVFELDGLFVALIREARFLRDPRAAERYAAAYQRLLRSFAA